MKHQVVYHRFYDWRSVTIIKKGRANYQLIMRDLYYNLEQTFTNLKVAKKEAAKLLS